MGPRNEREDDGGWVAAITAQSNPIERTLEDCFERPSNSRTALRAAASRRAKGPSLTSSSARNDAPPCERWGGVVVGKRMTKSDQIRALAKEGLRNADIARRLGIRPQFVSNVLRRSPSGRAAPPPKIMKVKPPLTTDILVTGGFVRTSQWLANHAELALDGDLPRVTGVYAMVQNGAALYVGVAAKSLHQRFKFYIKPGPSQSTSLRVREALLGELSAGRTIEIYLATPPTMAWNDLPVNGAAGLEAGLIATYSLPWNKRGTT